TPRSLPLAWMGIVLGALVFLATRRRWLRLVTGASTCAALVAAVPARFPERASAPTPPQSDTPTAIVPTPVTADPGYAPPWPGTATDSPGAAPPPEPEPERVPTRPRPAIRPPAREVSAVRSALRDGHAYHTAARYAAARSRFLQAHAGAESLIERYGALGELVQLRGEAAASLLRTERACRAEQLVLGADAGPCD
ncbi:MAG TPA: hypothetical protein VHG93_23220, partial [Longimicrobium sp.]|nr:hypothetical protein [Longimicrobium sp.]